MPIPIIAGAALAGGSMIANYMQNQNNAGQQFRRQKELQQREMDFNSRQAELAFQRQHQENELAFNREKEWLLNERDFNLPVNQLSRLRAAGINPATAYGNMENTQSQPLDMSAASPSGASVGGGSVAMAQTAELPELTSIMQGIKGLQLVDAQMKESQSRANYYDTLSQNVERDISKKDIQMPFWSDISKYDVDYRKWNARSVYRDVLDKVWKYNHLFPLSLQKMSSEIEGLNLNNRFMDKSFEDRLQEIVKRNLNLDASTSYYSDLKRNIDSQIGYRDIMATQQEMTGARLRGLYQSQEEINVARKQMMELQRSATQKLAKGDIVGALPQLIMLNFLQQVLGGHLTPNAQDMTHLSQTILPFLFTL